MIKTSYDQPKASRELSASNEAEPLPTFTAWGKPVTVGVAASAIVAMAMSQGMPTAFADVLNLLLL